MQRDGILPQKCRQAKKMAFGGKEEFLLFPIYHVIFVEEQIEIFARLREEKRLHAILERFVVH